MITTGGTQKVPRGKALAGLAALIRGEIDAESWIAGLRQVERTRRAA